MRRGSVRAKICAAASNYACVSVGANEVICAMPTVRSFAAEVEERARYKSALDTFVGKQLRTAQVLAARHSRDRRVHSFELRVEVVCVCSLLLLFLSLLAGVLRVLFDHIHLPAVHDLLHRTLLRSAGATTTTRRHNNNNKTSATAAAASKQANQHLPSSRSSRAGRRAAATATSRRRASSMARALSPSRSTYSHSPATLARSPRCLRPSRR